MTRTEKNLPLLSVNKNIQRILTVVFLLTALLSGWRMYALNEAEELWGHLPLFFYGSVWGLIVSALAGRWSRHTHNLRWLFFSTLSGVLLSLGFPPLPFVFLMFVGFVPLLLIEEEVAQDRSEPAKKLLLPYAYNTFVIWNILTTWWVGNTAFVAGIVAIWLNAFFMCVPILLFHHSKKKVPKTAYLGFIVYWLCFEFLHLNWEISWVWLNLGNAFAKFPSGIQWYSFTGTFGGSLWILYVNYLIFKLIKKYRTTRTKPRGIDLAETAAVIVLPILVSLAMYFNYEQKGEAVEVVVGQPNYEPHYAKFAPATAEARDREIVDLIRVSVTPETEYFIYPETVFANVDEDAPDGNKVIQKLRPILDKNPQLKIMAGVNAYHRLKPGDPDTRATRTRYRNDGQISLRYESLNAAVQIQKDQPTQTYRKSVFVPGAELLPYRDIFFWLKPLVDKLGGSMAGLGTQPYRSNFTSNTAVAAPVICYESVFGAYLAEYILPTKHNGGGADFIAVMTNDGWWDNTAGHKQHLYFSSLRAIENRRDVARSANTGISAFINQRGDITARTSYDVRTALTGQVHLNKEITFYTKWRDLIARIALFSAIILLLNTLVQGRLPKDRLQ